MRPTHDPDTQPIGRAGLGEKQRAAIALGVIAVAAVVLVIVMVSVLGSNNSPSSGTDTNAGGGPAVTVTGGASSNAPSQTHSSSSPSSAPSQIPPSNRQVSCPTQSPCALPDDIGNVVGAINAYRDSKGQGPVTGKVTQAAQTCAVNSGNNCTGGYFWEPAGRSGAEVVSKITSRGKGSSAMLAPSLSFVQVGWAYIPASKSFECAVIVNS